MGNTETKYFRKLEEQLPFVSRFMSGCQLTDDSLLTVENDLDDWPFIILPANITPFKRWLNCKMWYLSNPVKHFIMDLFMSATSQCGNFITATGVEFVISVDYIKTVHTYNTKNIRMILIPKKIHPDPWACSALTPYGNLPSEIIALHARSSSQL